MLNRVLGLALLAITATHGDSSSWKGHKEKYKDGWKWFARQRINRQGLIWIKGHPVWSLISNQTFTVLALVDTAMREVMKLDCHVEPEDVAKCRRAFSFLKAAALNLPYSTPRMIELYNSYKREMIGDLLESLAAISNSTLNYLRDKKSMRCKHLFGRLTTAMPGLNQADYDGTKGNIMPIEHVKPESRQFLVIDVPHESLLSSDSDSFEISVNHSLWRLLPTQYNLLIGRLFILSNQPTRSADVTRDLCAVAFLLESLNGITRSYYDINPGELNLISQTFSEVQVVLARLVNTLIQDQAEKTKWLSFLELNNSFNIVNAIVEQELGV